eukprot:COSAG01_NODE_73695_length_238_cov_154.179856_1_plen_67_part_10
MGNNINGVYMGYESGDPSWPSISTERIGSLSRKLLQELAMFTLGNLATSQVDYKRASHAYSQRDFRS